MPKPNQKSVTLHKETVERAKKYADKHGPFKRNGDGSVSGFVTELINEKTQEDS